MSPTKRTRDSKRSGANASGGSIEKGQSRPARGKAGSGPASGAEWMDETERDSPERQKVRSDITPPPGRKKR
jgi:hypothetical protein